VLESGHSSFLSVKMAVSHQSGTILHHWNDAPTKFIVKNKSAASSTTTLGIPTPPATPSQDAGNVGIASGLQGLLDMPSALVGRNREMVFARIRTLIKNIEDGKVTGASAFVIRC